MKEPHCEQNTGEVDREIKECVTGTSMSERQLEELSLTIFKCRKMPQNAAKFSFLTTFKLKKEDC